MTAQLTLRMLFPKTYSEITTDFLCALFIVNSMVKKSISDSIKATSDKSVQRMLKSDNDDKRELAELCDLELSDECKIFVDDILYFKRSYHDKINDGCLVSYMSWRLLTDERLKSFDFLHTHMYKNSYDAVASDLLSDIQQKTGVRISTKLEEFGRYLVTPLYRKQYSCIGRQAEIEKSLNILCRKKKRNLILVGNPGVGKTSIVYGICNEIQSERCPKQLSGVSVFELSVSALISGTTYRGDLEAKIETLVSESKEIGNLIIVVDELHTLFSSGFSSEGETQSIQQQLKPFLQEDSFLIGCTTESDYKVIEKDKAFERRFSVINVSEMSASDTKSLLVISKNQYEQFHSVEISDDICYEVVLDCEKFVKNRYFPDKAIDALDMSCVIASRRGASYVDLSDVDLALQSITNVSKFSDDVSEIKNNMKSVIFGQDHAIESVLSSFKRYKLGVNDKSRPIGSFLFVGKTGTGKTELCKQLAKNIFSNESFIRFDMSEFMELHSVSKLIGSPPGYVGYYAGGSLTEKVKHNPFSVILFDEVEKAHIDVLNVLLQIMDDGRLTDSFGSVIDFCNCIIVMTSNIGCSRSNEKKIGFSSVDVEKESILESVDKYFSPEFLARLDDVIYFNDINNDIIEKIVDRELNEFISTFNECGICVSIDEVCRSAIISLCTGIVGGVRGIRRKIRSILEPIVIENSIGNYLITHELGSFVCKTN